MNRLRVSHRLDRTLAAVANTLADALGFHVALPFTPSRIWGVLRQPGTLVP
jgi:hypothetical protein